MKLVITNKDAIPPSLNNEKIAQANELLTQPSFVYNGLTFTDFLMNNIKDLVAKCPTGKYTINIGDIVIGKDNMLLALQVILNNAAFIYNFVRQSDRSIVKQHQQY